MWDEGPYGEASSITKLGLRTLILLACASNMGYLASAEAQENSTNVLKLLTDDERIVLIGAKDTDPSTVAIVPRPFYTRQETNEDLMLNITAHGETFTLLLKKNHLISPTRHQSSNISSTIQNIPVFYQGYSSSHPNSLAAISLSDKNVHGYIQTPKYVLTVHPLPDHAAKKIGDQKLNFKPHLVVKRETTRDTFCPHALRRKNHWSVKNGTVSEKNNISSQQSLKSKEQLRQTDHDLEYKMRRRKRSPSDDDAVIETAVFIDQALYDQMRRTFPTDTDHQLNTFVMTMMNAVQRLFQHSSLGKSPNIRLVLMEILKTQPADLHPSDNIDTYLTNFCIWQHNRRHYGRGKSPRWDHALLLSGINMYVVDENGRRKRHVVGLAPVSGMCNPLNSCTISEGTSFQTVLVAAHEMGHSLGMEHDGFQDGNHCDSDTFVMSPTLGSGKTTWSSCSRQYLEKFLRSPQSSCLQASSPYVTDLLEPPPEKLPGQVYDADYQCTLRYGDGSRRSGLQTSEEICRMLRCDTGYGNKGVSFTAHPALEGTSCGRDKWCQGGSCAMMKRPPSSIHGGSSNSRPGAVDGQWSSWSPYSSCASDCVSRGSSSSVGLMLSTRRCENPRPQNGGRYCEGKDRRVLTCDATRICSSSSRKLLLDDFISDTCRQASARDNTIENSGTQFPSQENSHSCYVWCHKRGGGYMTQGWTIPDGTPCWRGFQNQNMYCVKGECQPFDCNGYSTENANDLSCSLTSAGAAPISSSDVSTDITSVWGPWHKVSQCRTSCLHSGQGFQLVSRECNAVTGCKGQKDTFKLCDAPRSACLMMKNIDQYAMEVCQRYRVKYPTVLSGKGRQLPPQPGNPHSACIVACQDRVWPDTHYQMDIYEDGKFPFGTDCSLDLRTKAYCLNGRCLQFDEEGIPVSSESHMYEVRRYLTHIRRRDTSGANYVINTIKESNIPKKKWTSGFGFFLFTNKKLDKRKSMVEVIAKLQYGWSVEMSECSVPCGGGLKNITVVCQTEGTVVSDGFCANINKPGQTGIWPCNIHPCSGKWQTGAWSACSVSCGEGFQTRDVVCLEEVTNKLFSMVHDNLCPSPAPLTTQSCVLPACDENNTNHLR